MTVLAADRKQGTIKREIEYSGIGLHTGSCVSMRFCPRPIGTGVEFRRVDLPGKPTIPAKLEYFQDTARNTTIGIGDVRVHTIEHVLAALSACHVDNVCVELSAAEPPVGRGSSDVFVEMLQDAGLQEQEAFFPTVTLKEPVYWSKDEIHLVALPYDGYRISYTLHYPQSLGIKTQYLSVEITPENFRKELAPCRTFCLYEEVSMLIDRGLIRGGSLDNSVIVKEDVVFSKGGLKFPDEMVRHKILDMVGDLSLLGYGLRAHILAVRSGHASNIAFAQEILNYITMENRDAIERH